MSGHHGGWRGFGAVFVLVATASLAVGQEDAPVTASLSDSSEAVEFEAASYPITGLYPGAGAYGPSPFTGTSEYPQEGDGCSCPRWSFSFTQTADYGTNLALPITLSPANTLISPISGLPQIIDLDLVTDLGLLDNLGLVPGVIPDVPALAVFEDDFQFQTLANLTRTSRVGDYGTLAAGYTYYQNLHPDLKALDIYSHTGTLQYAHQVREDRIIGGDYNYSYYFLDGNSYVSQNQLGLYALQNLNPCWDVLVRGDYADSNFRISDFLNSDNYALTFQGIRYLTEDRGDYLTLGYAAGYSDAVSRPFSYQVNNVFVGGRWLRGECNQHDIRLTASYGIYDFFGTDPIDVGVERQDEIFTLSAWYGRQITDNLLWFASYTYLNSESNVERNDYNSDLISLGITYFR